MPPRQFYKKYRVFVQTPSGNFVAASADSVNDLVGLMKAWLTRTTVGMELRPKASGYVIIQMLDQMTGAYQGGKSEPFNTKKGIITALRKLGGR